MSSAIIPYDIAKIVAKYLQESTGVPAEAMLAAVIDGVPQRDPIEIRRLIRELHEKGYAYRKIELILGVSPNTIRRETRRLPKHQCHVCKVGWWGARLYRYYLDKEKYPDVVFFLCSGHATAPVLEDTRKQIANFEDFLKLFEALAKALKDGEQKGAGPEGPGPPQGMPPGPGRGETPLSSTGTGKEGAETGGLADQSPGAAI